MIELRLCYTHKSRFSATLFSEILQEVNYMYAVIKTGGKQYKVALGEKLRVEKLNAEVNEEITLEEVLLVSKDGEIKVGAPLVAGAKVIATVIAQGKGKKVINFKYKPKKASARKVGHRQLFTQIEIKSIEA